MTKNEPVPLIPETKVPEKIVPEKIVPEKKTVQYTKIPQKNGIFMQLCWIAVIIILGTLLFLIWKNKIDQENLRETFTETQKIVEQHNQFFSQYLDQQLSVKKDMTQLQAEQIHLSDSIKRLNEIAFKNDQISHANFLASKIEYIIDLANIQLLIEKNFQKSIALLKYAEAILNNSTISNSDLAPLKEALAQDIATLTAITPIHVDFIIQSLSNISHEIPQLPLKIKIPPVNNDAHISPAIESPSDWKKSLTQTWHELKQMVQIRHYTEPVMPFLSVSEKQLLTENIQLILQTAIFAVVQQNDILFKNSLDDARTWITRYFDTTASETTKIMQTLENLSQTSIQTVGPNSLKTQVILQTIKIFAAQKVDPQSDIQIEPQNSHIQRQGERP